MIDRKALKILFDAHWKSAWKTDRSVSAEDRNYAKSKGMMFDPIEISHDSLVERICRLRDQISPKMVGDAFIASMTTRRLDLRSALGSYGVASQFPRHSLSSSPRRKVPSGADYCEICGLYNFPKAKSENLNVLNFERHKWGGVRRDDPIYIWFDLVEFQKAEKIVPTEEDREILQTILQIASGLPLNARPSVLANALSGVVKSNQAERRVLVEILSCCGVLQPRGHSGYFGEFTPVFEREHTGEHTNDWGYPAIWWRGGDGVNSTAVDAYFPGLQ